MSAFVVAATSDFFMPDGSPKFPEFDPSLLRDDPGVDFRVIECGDAVPQGALEGVDALILLRPRITRESLAGIDRLSLISRFGVGYERVDVAACNAAAVALSITSFAVRRPVAVAELTMLLALAGRLIAKDDIVRRGPDAWSERTLHNGTGLTGRTLGTIGLGGIARELIGLIAPLGMRVMGFDPHVQEGLPSDVTVCDFDTLLAESDFLVINCPFTSETDGMIGAAELGRMKRSAFLINTARGGIVQEHALATALKEGTIAGAGVDVFSVEPVGLDNPLLTAPNTILSPHSIAWTDENFQKIGESILKSVSDVRRGQVPEDLANPSIGNNCDWLRKLAVLADRLVA